MVIVINIIIIIIIIIVIIIILSKREIYPTKLQANGSTLKYKALKTGQMLLPYNNNEAVKYVLSLANVSS